MSIYNVRLKFNNLKMILEKLANNIRDFKNGGFKDIYKLIFGSPQFPFWFTIQAIWSCYVVCLSTMKQRRTIMLWIKQLIISAMLTFLPRELFAFIFHKLSPILHNPSRIGIYLVVFMLLTYSPMDIFYKITNVLYYFIGLMQGLNQARLFSLIIRSTRNYNSFQMVSIAILFVIMDQLLEIITRLLVTKGEETKVSNRLTIFRTGIISLLFWLITHNNPLTKYIGLYQIYIPALIYSFVLGLLNSSAILDIGGEKVPTPPPTPRPKRSSSSTPTPIQNKYQRTSDYYYHY